MTVAADRDRFEPHRGHLQAVAYRMLGSTAAAEDAVQETWLRYSNADTGDVENLRGWLTTVVSRVCLNMLRARRHRREDLLDGSMLGPIVTPYPDDDPEYQAVLADSVSAALVVVLEQLTPNERLCFVLHDVFAVPFDEIGSIIDATPASARQLASRARRRVQAAPAASADTLAEHRKIVAAFFDAAHHGNFEALVALLHDSVELHADGGPLHPERTDHVSGPAAIANRAIMFATPAASLVPVLVDDRAGVVVVIQGRPTTIMDFVIAGGLITAIRSLSDPTRIAGIDLTHVIS